MQYVLYCLFAILPIYQDSPLALYAGAYGYSIVPAVSIVLVIPIYWLCRGRRDGVFTTGWGRLIIYLLFINLIAVLVWHLTGHGEVIRGESIIFKAIKGYAFTVSAYAYLVIMRTLSHDLSESQACRPFVMAFLILAVVAIIELMQMPYALEWLHASGAFPYWRPRLLSTEASWTTMLIAVYGGVSVHYYRKVVNNNLGLLWVMPSLILMLMTSRSKALIIVTIMALLVLWIWMLCRDVRYILIAPVVGVLVVATGSWSHLEAMLVSDISQFTSVSTRVYSWIVSVIYMIHYPLGTGNALYVDLYSNMLIDRIDLLELLPFNTNPNEILAYARNTTSDAGLSAKSALLQYGMYWGFLGSGGFIYLFKRADKAIRERGNLFILRAVLLIEFVGICFFASIDYEYELFSLMALCDWYIVHDDKESRGSYKAMGMSNG